MATITFSKSTNVLSWPGFGSWSAVSGGWGDPLPSGTYTVERRKVTGYTKSIGVGFQDKTGKGYFVPLTPHFSSTRTGIGIHPDGNLPGTKGCIGIRSNADTFYRAIASTAPSASITLQAID
jgi:hypothetical protein